MVVNIEKVEGATHISAVVNSIRGAVINCFDVSTTFESVFNATSGNSSGIAWMETATNYEFKATACELLTVYFNGSLLTGFNNYWSFNTEV